MTTEGFNPARLSLLRERAGLTKDALADACGVSRRAVTDWEAGKVLAPPLERLAGVFSVDISFFHRENAIELDENYVSFRALSSMGARKSRRVLAAARLSLELGQWLDARYNTPPVGVPTLDDLLDRHGHGDMTPAAAGELLRRVWNLGDRPVRDMLAQLERHGVRVFSVPAADRDVDAFSFWHEGRPYVFLNVDKSAERLRFDLAHELAHLVLHREVVTARERTYEAEANQFASSFLLPAAGVLAQASTAAGPLTLKDVMVMKRSWKVSAVAMVRRLYDLGLIIDWHYRNWMVDLSAKGYRRGEPDGLHAEQSNLIASLLTHVREDRIGLAGMARESGVPLDAIKDAFTGLVMLPLDGGDDTRRSESRRRTRLTVV